MLLGAFKDRSNASIRKEIYQRGCICENPCDELGDDLVDVGEAIGREMLEAARRVMAMADEIGLELGSVRRSASWQRRPPPGSKRPSRTRGEGAKFGPIGKSGSRRPQPAAGLCTTCRGSSCRRSPWRSRPQRPRVTQRAARFGAAVASE
jgi:hypothetical protein